MREPLRVPPSGDAGPAADRISWPIHEMSPLPTGHGVRLKPSARNRAVPATDRRRLDGFSRPDHADTLPIRCMRGVRASNATLRPVTRIGRRRAGPLSFGYSSPLRRLGYWPPAPTRSRSASTPRSPTTGPIPSASRTRSARTSPAWPTSSRAQPPAQPHRTRPVAAGHGTTRRQQRHLRRRSGHRTDHRPPDLAAQR
jgi:hypothetical protein